MSTDFWRSESCRPLLNGCPSSGAWFTGSYILSRWVQSRERGRTIYFRFEQAKITGNPRHFWHFLLKSWSSYEFSYQLFRLECWLLALPMNNAIIDHCSKCRISYAWKDPCSQSFAFWGRWVNKPRWRTLRLNCQ